ncbi:MAG: nitroreductase family protein [Lachnospiraceae bacterium]|nr:nitroreductase family protein [Lachnospiraceae bacterium]
MNTEEAIFTRRSIRKYEDRPVEDEKIEKLLRAAMAAPSAMNQQPWEFYVVKDKEKIRELGDATPHSRCVSGAPLAIVVCQKTGSKPAPAFADVDCAIATENMLIMATELGLGTVWIGTCPVAERVEKVGEILNIAEGLKAFALIGVGYPAEEKGPSDRYDESRVHVL